MSHTNKNKGSGQGGYSYNAEWFIQKVARDRRRKKAAKAAKRKNR